MKHHPIISYPFVPGKRDALGRPVQQTVVRCTCKQWSTIIKERGEKESAAIDEAFNFHLAQAGQRR